MGKLATSLFCDGLIDEELAEYVRRKRPINIAECVGFDNRFIEGKGSRASAYIAQTTEKTMSHAVVSAVDVAMTDIDWSEPTVLGEEDDILDKPCEAG